MVSIFTPERSLPATLGAGVFAVSLLASLLGAPHHAHAAAGCRSDPIVVLSNGTILDLSAVIGADVSTVTRISYTLHAPAGTSVVKVISTDGDVQYKEQFALRTDNPTGGYGVQVQVQTTPQPGTPPPVVVATIEGGAATTLGVTPAMVGLTFWSGATTVAVPDGPQGPGPHGDGPHGDGPHGDGPHGDGPQLAQTVSSLPDAMTAQIASWAATAAWSVTASTTGQAGATPVASVTLL